MLQSYTDVHVLNVGRGSCTVIASPSGRATMIDINDGGKLRPEEYEAIKQSSLLLAEARIKKEEQLLDDPIDWFKAHVGTSMWRFILSHPDMDHLSGIRRLLSGSSCIEVLHFWDYDHTRTRKESDFPTPAGWLDWRWYMGFHKQYRWDGVTWPKRIHPLRRDNGNYWTDDSIQILSPTPMLISDCDDRDEYNDASYVLRIGHGPTSHVLAPGDVEDKAWNDMIAADVPLRANVLIASHHGRNNGYHEGALDRIKPEVVIISSDAIPAKDDAIQKYKKRSMVFSTREHGTLTVRMHDGGRVQIIDRYGNELYSMSDRAVSSLA
jgi:beta-lactamase superfamily II metal-dependent hydrolase